MGYNPNVFHLYVGWVSSNPLILTIDPKFQQDIQVHMVPVFPSFFDTTRWGRSRLPHLIFWKTNREMSHEQNRPTFHWILVGS